MYCRSLFVCPSLGGCLSGHVSFWCERIAAIKGALFSFEEVILIRRVGSTLTELNFFFFFFLGLNKLFCHDRNN